jgi:hypothetical protein
VYFFVSNIANVLKGEKGMEKDELLHLRRVVKLSLIRIGIRCDLIGFSYLCYAVELVVQKPKLIHNLCKGLYIEVGKQFAINNENCVERSIRHAIENTYINKSFVELNRMFKTQLYTIDEKPTAGELIRLVAEYYNLGLYKNQIDTFK